MKIHLVGDQNPLRYNHTTWIFTLDIAQ